MTEENSGAPAPRKKIMYLIWSLDKGGAEQVVINLAGHLDASRFEAEVVCLNEKGRLADTLEKRGIRVTALEKKGALDFAFLTRLIALLRKEKPDLIHTHLFTSHLWGRIAAFMEKIPVVCTEHNVDLWKRPLHFFLDMCLIQNTAKMIYVSKKVKEFYDRKLRGFSAKGIVVYNGIEIERFEAAASKRDEFRRQWGFEKEDFVIGTVGRLVPQKNQKGFLQALAVLKKDFPRVRGLIMGEGELEKELKEEAKRLGLGESILFGGFRQNMETVYPVMDLFTLSSFREGFPMTMLEAMAAGLPVVSTDVGGVRECIENEKHGFLISSGDAQALASAWKEVLINPERRDAMALQCRTKVRSAFSVAAMCRQHEEIYRGILNEM